MAKFFIDCEFIEDGKTIDLISIGIVSQDNREYYACNDECDLMKASEWVRKNVLTQLPFKHTTVNPSDPWVSPSVKQEILTWKMRDQIASEIIEFCNPTKYGKIEFIGYYSSYDHVCLYQLFGTMMDLPEGFPMYTKDIKQTIDELGNPQIPKQTQGLHNALSDAKWIKDTYLWLQQNYQHPAFKND